MASNTTSGWANTNTATVRPRGETDTENGGVMWGEPYEIECTWRMPKEQKVLSDSQGREVVPAWEVHTEDARPRVFDEIRLNSTNPEWREILGKNEDDMSFFGEPPAFRLDT